MTEKINQVGDLKLIYSWNTKEEYWKFVSSTSPKFSELYMLIHRVSMDDMIEIIQNACKASPEKRIACFEKTWMLVEESNKIAYDQNPEGAIAQLTRAILDYVGIWFPGHTSQEYVYWKEVGPFVEAAHDLVFNGSTDNPKLRAALPLPSIEQYHEQQLGVFDAEKTPEPFGWTYFVTFALGVDQLFTSLDEIQGLVPDMFAALFDYEFMDISDVQKVRPSALSIDATKIGVYQVASNFLRYALIWPADIHAGRVKLPDDAAHFLDAVLDMYRMCMPQVFDNVEKVLT